MKVFLLFLDGVGLGSKHPEENPFFRAALPTFRSMFGGELPHLRGRVQEGKLGVAFGIDANLGVEGLPQSGTGQATIFTGQNGAKSFGRHFGPFLPTALRPLVTTQSIFSIVKKNAKRAILANAFPKKYFEYTQDGTRRLSAITFASVSAQIPLLTASELASDRAVSADFVRDRWPELGHPEIAAVTPYSAGKHCAEIIREHDITVFDYWLPDHAGHSQNMKNAVHVLERLDAFLQGVLDHVDLRSVSIIGVSDHGNIEDLRTKMHTRNPALGFIVGRRRDAMHRLRSLTDIAPFVYECLNIHHPQGGG